MWNTNCVVWGEAANCLIPDGCCVHCFLSLESSAVSRLDDDVFAGLHFEWCSANLFLSSEHVIILNSLFWSYNREVNVTVAPHQMETRALQTKRKTLFYKMMWTDIKHTHTHTHINAHSNTHSWCCAFTDDASFQHIKLKHCHKVLCSVYFKP